MLQEIYPEQDKYMERKIKSTKKEINIISGGKFSLNIEYTLYEKIDDESKGTFMLKEYISCDKINKILYKGNYSVILLPDNDYRVIVGDNLPNLLHFM